MKGFVLGVLLSSLAWGAAFYHYEVRRPQDVEEEVAVETASEAPAPARRRRAARRPPRAPGAPASGSSEESAVPERQLSAADLRSVSRGDDLSRPDVVQLDMASGETSAELTQDEIDLRFRARQEDVLGCIERARPDPSTYVPGRVTIEFRIQRTGQVRGVRVAAPAILHQGGLHACIKNVVMGLRFPDSGGSQVVSYPFDLS